MGVYHPKRVLALPQIFVKVKPRDWRDKEFVAAQIKLRRRCYRYLVWREAGKKQELYLGKVKILAPAASSPAPAIDVRTRRSSSGSAGGKKREVK